MTLETITTHTINSLVAANPAGGDKKSEGDDHIRAIKKAVLNTFPAITGAVTPTHTELNYVDGVTSAIQGQLDLKAPSASPTFTGTVVLPATTSIGTVSSAELGYVDGVTSAIQTQLDSKAPASGPTFTGTAVLPATTSIGSVSSVELGYVDGVTSSIQTQLDSKAPLSSPTLQGIPTAPTAETGSDTNQIANCAFVAATSLIAALPGQTGNAGKVMTTDGANASWQNAVDITSIPSYVSGAISDATTPINSAIGTLQSDVSTLQSTLSTEQGYIDTLQSKMSTVEADIATMETKDWESRSSNTIFSAADSGKMIKYTGSFTQTFNAAATLGAGWSVTLFNSLAGTSYISLDPNSAETIDGRTTIRMYSQEKRIIRCNGTSFTSEIISPFYILKTAPSVETINYISGYSAIDVELWGAGGGGGARGLTSTLATYGGGGGGYSRARVHKGALVFGEDITLTGAYGGVAGYSTTATVGVGGAGETVKFTHRYLEITASGGGGGGGAAGAGGAGNISNGQASTLSNLGSVVGVLGGAAGGSISTTNTVYTPGVSGLVDNLISGATGAAVYNIGGGEGGEGAVACGGGAHEETTLGSASGGSGGVGKIIMYGVI